MGYQKVTSARLAAEAFLLLLRDQDNQLISVERLKAISL
jgi:hypothetical protein